MELKLYNMEALRTDSKPKCIQHQNPGKAQQLKAFHSLERSGSGNKIGWGCK